jgi:hypothetical protein
MIAVITGDIINSRHIKNDPFWIARLKEVLSQYGVQGQHWEIFRGDGFQLEVAQPLDALKIMLHIKAALKQVGQTDARMAIGIGQKDVVATSVSESNGQAFVFSGEALENLKKDKQNLRIITPWNDFNQEQNVLMKLASLAINDWKKGSAELVYMLCQNDQRTQHEIAQMLGIKQSAVSQRLARAHYDTLMEWNDLYRQKLQLKLDHGPNLH